MPGDVLVVVDMQVGLLDGTPKHDLGGVIQRINALAAMVRQHGGQVVWIRHRGKAGDGFEPDSKGWAFLPEVVQEPHDIVVEKTLNNSFAGTALHDDAAADRAGSRPGSPAGPPTPASNSTVRSAISRDYDVVVASDAHTVSDRHASRRDRHHRPSQLGLERPSDQLARSASQPPMS